MGRKANAFRCGLFGHQWKIVVQPFHEKMWYWVFWHLPSLRSALGMQCHGC